MSLAVHSVLSESAPRAAAGMQAPPRAAVVCLVAAALLFAPAAQAALPGRADAADILRLMAYGLGPVEIAGPAGDAATGALDSRGYGPPGCDGAWSHRRVIAPRVGMTVEVPEGARWLDIIVRPVREVRELVVSLDKNRLHSQPLVAGWQRVRVPLIDVASGPHRLELMLAATGEPLAGDGGVPSEVLALLHAVVVSTATRGPETGLDGPLVAGDTVWLEAGTSLRLPIQSDAGQALETSGLKVRGKSAGLRVVVERESLEGAVDPLLDWPAELQIPWNLSLERRQARTPVWLNVRITGDAAGAIGLVAPRLTIPARPPAAVQKTPEAVRTVLVAVAGLRADDADAVAMRIPGATRLQSVWSTSPEPRTALVSLLTGTYPETHGVIGRKDRLRSGLQGIGWAATRANVHAVARLGNLPVAADDKLWEGWADVKSASKGAFRGLAREVLAETLTAVDAAGDKPVLAVAVLTDPLPPLMPRAGDAWERHWPKEAGKPPWPPGESRARLGSLATSGKTLTGDERRWVRALRRGKVDETLRAIVQFIGSLTEGPNARPTRVVVVGLGGSDPDRSQGIDLAAVHVPAWTVGVGLSETDARQTLDLTDVSALVANLAKVPGVPNLQGAAPSLGQAPLWGGVAYASHARRWDVAASDALVLLSDRVAGSQVVFERTDAGGWSATESVSSARRLPLRMQRERLDAWRAAKGHWRQDHFEPAAHDRGVGHGRACPR